MAYAYASRLALPSRREITSNTPAITSFALNTVSYKVAGAFSAAIADTLTAVAYYQTSIGSSPVAASYRVGIQALNSSGLPSGTWAGATNNAFVDIQPVAGDTSKYRWCTLGESVTVVAGQIYVVVVERLAATAAASDMSVGYSVAYAAGGERVAFPWAASANPTTWARAVTAEPHFMVRGAYYQGDPFCVWNTAATFGGTTEVGASFILPASWTGTYKLAGARLMWANSSTGANTAYMTLYGNPASGTIAILDQTAAIDCDVWSDGSALREVEFFFASPVNLTPGTKYGIGFSTSAGSAGTIYYDVITVAADKAAASNGLQLSYMLRTLNSYPPSGDDTANFSEVTTAWPVVELIFADLTTGGGGGMLFIPNMAGT